ncbi:MAG: hypothetical protein K6T59_08055 [Bryobacteraceae bacterium]|nr:hypothetical protein [Bryobacteraceae bacterium]
MAMALIREAELPGLGKKYQMTLENGEEVAVIIHDDGHREIYHFLPDGDDAVDSFLLNDQEARQLGSIIGGAFYQPRALEKLEAAVADLRIDWLKVKETSPINGRSIGELGLRKNHAIVVVAVIVGLVALRFVFYRWASPEPDYVSIPGEHGQIRISFETIRQLANRTGRTVRGVQELETRVRAGQNGILLAIRVKALPDLELDKVSGELQSAIKAYVERTTGLNVERVVVNVAEVTGSPAKNTKAWVE